MSKAFLDVLHARQPKLDYISPAVCEYIFSGSGFGELLLDDWGLDAIQGWMNVYGDNGDHNLNWGTREGNICVMVWRADDPDNPLTSTYTLVADCVQPPWNPPDPPPPNCVGCPPPRPPCYTLQVLTEAGLSPFSVPICPPPPPPSCPQCGGGGGGSQLTCFTDSGNRHAIVDNPYSWTPTKVTAGQGTYSITVGALPPGLTLNTATGEVSGTPTTVGSYPVVLQIIYWPSGLACSQNFTFLVEECITTSGTLPDAWMDAPYTLDLAAFEPGGVFTVILGSLPFGFTLAADGELSGLAEETGDFAFTVGYTLGSDLCSKDFNLHVGPSCISTDGPLTPGMEDEIYSQTLLASFPDAGQEWTITSGFLPTSLTLGLLTGEISGTPDLGTAGDYAVTIRLTNTDLSFCEENFAITILENALTCIINNAVLAAGEEEQAYSVALTANSPEGGQVWSLVDGILPPGLTLDPDTGVISGIADAGSADLYFFTIRLTNLDTSFCEKEFEIAIAPAEGLCVNMPGFNVLPAAEEGVAYSETLVAADPEAGQVWSVEGGAFPTGISLTGAVISGTPDPGTAGSYFINIRLTNVDTTYCEVNFSLEVTTGDCITTGAVLPDGKVGDDYSQALVAADPDFGQVWEISAGSLPDGVILNYNTGVIDGNPDGGMDGFYEFTVKLTNIDTTFCEKAFQLTIDPIGSPCFAPANLSPLLKNSGTPYGGGYFVGPTPGGNGPTQTIEAHSPGDGSGASWVGESNSTSNSTQSCDFELRTQITCTTSNPSVHVSNASLRFRIDGFTQVLETANAASSPLDHTFPFTLSSGPHDIQIYITLATIGVDGEEHATVTYTLTAVP